MRFTIKMLKEIKYKINKNDCYVCTSHSLDSEGYVSCKRNGKKMPIYRHIYRFFKGAPKKGMVIRHTCDNRRCINPNHLVLGSHQDNVKDRVLRGRSAKGEANGRSKLTERQVLAIYKDKKNTRVELGIKYNVHRQAIRKIQLGETWKYLTQK